MSTIPLCTHRYIGLRNSCWAEISIFLMVIHDCKPYSQRAVGEPVHHTSVSSYAQSRDGQINIQRVRCLSFLVWSLFHCAGGLWSQHMMGRGLERGVGCLPALDQRQHAPSWCMQGTSTSHTYHLTTRLRQVHRVVYMAPLGELCNRSDRQALQFH